MILLVSLLSSTLAFASSDTVKYRLVQSWLPDSSMIRYELGSICHYGGGATTYIGFADTFGSNFATTWRSNNFTINGTNDSVSFFRFASFDNQYVVDGLVPDTTTNPMDSALSALINASLSRYIDTGFYIHPAPSSFSATSIILYVVELRNASNDSILENLDTLECFLNDSGRLRYCALGDRQKRLCSLYGIPNGTNVYLNVERYSSLPQGSHIIADDYVVEGHNNPYGDSLHYFAFQDSCKYAYIALKRSSAQAGSSPDEAIISKPGEITVSSASKSSATLKIFDELGRTVESRSLDLDQGLNAVTLNLNALPQEPLFVEVEQFQDIVFSEHLVNLGNGTAVALATPTYASASTAHVKLDTGSGHSTNHFNIKRARVIAQAYARENKGRRPLSTGSQGMIFKGYASDCGGCNALGGSRYMNGEQGLGPDNAVGEMWTLLPDYGDVTNAGSTQGYQICTGLNPFGDPDPIGNWEDLGDWG